MSKNQWVESTGNVFEDVGLSGEQSKRLQFRSFLMIAVMKYIQSENITQKEAAKRLKVTQSRISNLLHFKIDLFSTDMLLDMLERAGFKVYEKMEQDIVTAIDRPWFRLPVEAMVAA
jgi:predicted XRE-type DNA-binding protein